MAGSELFESSVHTEAISRLLYLVESECEYGLVHGPDGSGRTVLLNRLEDELKRQQIRCVLLNVAALDDEAVLLQVAESLGVDCGSNCRRASLLIRLRDELTARACSGIRTVLLFDDVHLAASDLSVCVPYFSAPGPGTERSGGSGSTTMIAASRSLRVANLSMTPSLVVSLTSLDDVESRDFVIDRLIRRGLSTAPSDTAMVAAVVEQAGGLPSRLARLCDLLIVVREASPETRIDAEVVHAVARQLIPRAVA